MRKTIRGIRVSVSNIGFLCLLGTVIGLQGPTASGAPAAPVSSSSESPGAHNVESSASKFTGRSSEIRVRIFDRIQSRNIHLSNSGSGLTIYVGDNDTPIYQIRTGTTIELSIGGTDVYLRAGNKGLHAGSIRIAASDGETFSLRTQSGPVGTRQYFGQLEVRVRPDGLGFEMINRVPLEAYIEAVVGSEYGLGDLEGSKAMAVAARTYAVYAMQNVENTFHLVDSDRAQVYRGAAAATPLTREAARATAGEVLTHEGEPIEAVYSSSNGGHSANNESIWAGTPFSYLRGRKDPYDSVSPDASWRFELEAKALHRELSRRYGLKVKEVRFDRPGSDGRVTSVTLVSDGGRDRVISGSQFRWAVVSNHGEKSLKSTFFKARKKRGKYRFDGHGYGHGVGLSQWGAHGMANSGYGYRDILDFYYPGTRLDQRFEGSSLTPGAVSLPVIAANSGASSSWTSSTVSTVASWGRSMDSKVKSEAASVEGSSSSSTRSSGEKSTRLKKHRLGW